MPALWRARAPQIKFHTRHRSISANQRRPLGTTARRDGSTDLVLISADRPTCGHGRPSTLLAGEGNFGVRRPSRRALGEASGATCVQRLDDSRDSAIHTKYRISLHSSSWREPRYPLPRVVISLCFLSFVRPKRTRRLDRTSFFWISKVRDAHPCVGC